MIVSVICEGYTVSNKDEVKYSKNAFTDFLNDFSISQMARIVID